MYLHRPDLLSLVFGLLFLPLGLWALLAPSPGTPDPLVIAAVLAITTGVGVIGTMLTGDVHRRAAERMARARPARNPVTQPEPPPWHTPVLDDPFLADPMFAPPIDPQTLDEEYRRTFGEDAPDAGPTDPSPDGSGEGAADGTTG